jgi:hypothetical protein
MGPHPAAQAKSPMYPSTRPRPRSEPLLVVSLPRSISYQQIVNVYSVGRPPKPARTYLAFIVT